jgi:hypothetical protein
MKSKTIISHFAILFISWTLACSDTNDLGRTCNLVKKGPDGSTVELTEKEAQEALNGLNTGDKGSTLLMDLVTLGATECEDLACIRDSRSEKGPLESPIAKGFCSMRCSSEGSSCKASDSKTKYVCRQLMLDPETWKEICDANPDNCIDVSSTLFCAREINN